MRFHLIAVLIYYQVGGTYSQPLINELINHDPNPLKEPLALYSENGVLNVTISVEAFRFEDFIEFTTRAYCHERICSIPGKAFVMMMSDIIFLKSIFQDPRGM